MVYTRQTRTVEPVRRSDFSMKQTKLYVAWFIITSYHWNAILAAEETSTISCIHELPLTSTKTKVIGYPVNIEMKTCRCGTIEEDTHNRFINAYAKFGSQCENVTTNSTGVCFNKTLDNTESAIDGWKEYSYAICLFQLTANETYKEISVKKENIFKRITIGNRHVIDLPLNADVFIHDGILKKIDVIEGRCEEIKYFDGTYYTEKDKEKNLWKKKPSNIETGVDFELNDWFVIPNTTTSDLVGKYEENVDNITQNVCASHYGPDFYSFNAKGTIPGSFKPGEEIGEGVDAESFKINTETIEIYENYKLRIENITSDKYFFFDGVIRNACDGNQYLVITNRSHDKQIIRGTIKVHNQEFITVALGKNSTKLKGNYTQEQLVGAFVKDDISTKTYRMITISNDTCLEPIDKGNPNSAPTAINIAISFTITLVTLGIVGIFAYRFWKRIRENKNESPQSEPCPRVNADRSTSDTDHSDTPTNPAQTGSSINSSQSQNPADHTRQDSLPHTPQLDQQIPGGINDLTINMDPAQNVNDINLTARTTNNRNSMEPVTPPVASSTTHSNQPSVQVTSEQTGNAALQTGIKKSSPPNLPTVPTVGVFDPRTSPDGCNSIPINSYVQTSNNYFGPVHKIYNSNSNSVVNAIDTDIPSVNQQISDEHEFFQSCEL